VWSHEEVGQEGGLKNQGLSKMKATRDPPCILAVEEHVELEEVDEKAVTFATMFSQYQITVKLEDQLTEKGWKVKRKLWVWWTSTGEHLVFLTIYEACYGC
jgi:hypothetical protein